MKPGGAFALNTHATSYVPLSKKVDCDDMDGLATHSVHEQQQIFIPKTLSEMAYKQIRDDDDLDIDMDIEYLLVTFSGLSQESITDVYLANGADLEETFEMLNHFEIYSTETKENLPEMLDLGDLSETGPSTSKASAQKTAATEVAVSPPLDIPSAIVSA
ncbi:unnamed protein product [Eruca vesicaria subsp. sativa]|uniref:CUE domain-containing protein n=1 Tax=Eruca vesicaria subsp. sativa TaxID=29727 RepID=A0ABC8JIQ2_ERUVS|nr:unnamed protein product [Eruca vesicaria subsp. sativa]